MCSHEYMFVEVGVALIVHSAVSLVVAPVAVGAMVAHAPDAIAAVPSALVPLATVIDTVPDDGNVAVDEIPVPPFVLPSNPVTWVARLTTVTAAKQKIEHPRMIRMAIRRIIPHLS
jgi:hypothetical protein